MKRVLIGLGVVVLLVLVGMTIRYQFSGPSDRELIRQALDEATASSRAGEPGGVIDQLSRNLTYNGEPVGSNREIMEFIRKAEPDVQVISREPDIQGDTASISSPVSVTMGFGGFKQTQIIDGVRIEFAKETGREWGIFPKKVWRISAIEAEGANLSY